MSNDADERPADDGDGGRGVRLPRITRHRDRDREHDERFAERMAQQLAQQWALVRAERRPEPVPVEYGPSNFRPAQVPWGVDLAAAWSWRLLVIGAAGLAVLWLLSFFMVVTLPIAISILIAALAAPLMRALCRVGLPRGAAAGLIVLGGLALVGSLLTFVGTQVVSGAYDLADQVANGLGKIREWLRDGPLDVSDSQITAWLEQAQTALTERTRDPEVVGQVTAFGSALGHVLAGFFIVLFATFFFLADGERIWAWTVRMFPRAARERVDSSGRVAWVSLTQFVRATVVVALVDAVGIMVVAAILGLPLVLPIGVLVFLGAFVPMIGATVAGGVAVLVALVSAGPITALLMLGGVLLVQNIEGHVLQPFLMGRFVALHPLGIIAAIGCGVIVAGIVGALIAVPLVAVVNAIGQHLAAYTDPGDEPDRALDEELARRPDDPSTPAEPLTEGDRGE